MEEKCKHEVVALHQFFQAWFNGELARDEQRFARFAGVLEEGFEMVSPGGKTLDRAAVLAGVEGAHGSYSQSPCRIWIEAVKVRDLGGGLYLVSYEEWQDRDGQTRARQSTALLAQAEGKPLGLSWKHVHETWMSK